MQPWPQLEYVLLFLLSEKVTPFPVQCGQCLTASRDHPLMWMTEHGLAFIWLLMSNCSMDSCKCDSHSRAIVSRQTLLPFWVL